MLFASFFCFQKVHILITEGRMSGIYDGALTQEHFMFLEMRKVAQMTILSLIHI